METTKQNGEKIASEELEKIQQDIAVVTNATLEQAGIRLFKQSPPSTKSVKPASNGKSGAAEVR